MKTPNMIWLLAVTALLFSCSENEEEPSAAINEAQLLGQWETVLVRYDYYDEEGKLINSSEVNSSEAGGEGHETWMTFNPDKTFNHRDTEGTRHGIMLQDVFPENGHWELKDGNRIINLTTYAQPSAADWQVASFSTDRLSIILTETDASGSKTDRIVELVK